MKKKKIPAWLLASCLGVLSILSQTACAEQSEEEEFYEIEEWHEEHHGGHGREEWVEEYEEYPEDVSEDYEEEYYEDADEELDEDMSEKSTEQLFERDKYSPGELHLIEDFKILGIEEAKKVFELLNYEELPEFCSLDVKSIEQEPELPTGCESVALTMALTYEGFELEKTTIAQEYLILNRATDNMAIGYVGDPFSSEGAGCFPPALVATADNYFETNEEPYAAYDITDSEFEELLSYVASGTPVIVWTTMYMAEPEFTGEVGKFDEKEYPWYRQEHCVVISGFDLKNHTVKINDPLEGIVDRNLDEFKSIFERTGKNAIVLGPIEESEENVE